MGDASIVRNVQSSMIFLAIAALQSPRTVTVDVESQRVLNIINARAAIGGALDGHGLGDTAKIYTPHNLREMSQSGLGAISYRLRTELGVEAWHWNPTGSWSDPKDRQGYWTSSSTVNGAIKVCYGYRLPRRGDTIDQANNDGYSRIDDGDLETYWKSNPYLDARVTGQPDREDPQWVMVDLGRKRKVDALQITWANPYALDFKVEYWTGVDAIGQGDGGEWRAFKGGSFHQSSPLSAPLRLGESRDVRFVRISLLASSHTAEPSSHPDPRDHLGYAVRELEVGRWKDGSISDLVRHVKGHRQTLIYVSSTDPWHRETDLDKGVEQPGFDTVLNSGLGAHEQILIPVPVLYSTPADAAAEYRWLLHRGARVPQLELGEEPDGQLATPEQFAKLYLEFAHALRRVNSHVKLGAPSFQTSLPDIPAWPDRGRSRIWLTRFLEFLERRKEQPQFLSFEWYPIENTAEKTRLALRAGPGLLTRYIHRFRRDGLPENLPLYITEYGYASSACPQEDDIPGALVNIDLLGTFLNLGGNRAYLYGFEPDRPYREAGDVWGNMMLLQSDRRGSARWRLPTFWAARMSALDWCNPGSNRILDVTVSPASKSLSFYAVRRPNGSVAVLVLNKSNQRPLDLTIQTDGKRWEGSRYVQYGREQYDWIKASGRSRPGLDLSPKLGAFGQVVHLPPMSFTVLTRA